MNNIWFVKNEQQINIDTGLVFNLNAKNSKSNIKTDVENLWRMFSEKSPSKIIEDLLLIGMSVFSVDKKISRKKAEDGWSRNLNLHIPVLEFEKWEAVKHELEETLSFLSGDKWIFNFYPTEERLRGDKVNKRYNIREKTDFDCVSLFSGGLDSFCGALSLMEDNRNPLFLGFKEYPLLLRKQTSLIESIQEEYTNQKMDFIQFNVSPRRPLNVDSNVILGESTSRSRSFLFIAGAVAVASIIGKHTPVYIPENGFIGINVPLTQSRNGSCSTRTTHPYFIGLVNQLLTNLGIEHKVENFYSQKSKGEIVSQHRENEVFRHMYKETLSCSHPCQSRYDGISPPLNCGYCYPCLIRRASLVVNGFMDNHYNPKYSLNKEFIQQNHKVDGKASDFKAVLYTIRRYMDNEHNETYIRRLLRLQGHLSSQELDSYQSVYRKSINELLAVIDYEDKANNGELRKYMGLEQNHEEFC
ncbi:Qat anti-phage system QueC-like protein QatC [Priestia megaterium]|uniref:Qat anti-phage system QueC-like protein QatC n=1 Tax=Priestia megaterium TaxID=1404 RepID=UPI0012B904B3|nr:Qat anti-phage system QueC-like protein QatC [Priestia megaterium]